jgi:hypothetical protein
MKKTTSQNLSKRLAKYGALSVAIAGVAEANGQIIYTDVEPSGGFNTVYELDLNNDGIKDFRIFGGGVGTFSSYAFVGIYNGPLGSSYAALNNNSFLGDAPSYIYPFALNYNDPIGSTQATWFDAAANFGTMNFVSCFGGSGSSHWCGATDKYLGLKFTVLNGPGPGDDETFYGWARLDVSLDAFTWVLKDYAYESSPGVAILAGDTGTLGIGENELNKIKVVSLNKSIGLYNLPSSASYNLYNMTGQEVLKGTTNQKDYVIEASTLASGVYIVELGDANTNAVIRKKVVLQ